MEVTEIASEAPKRPQKRLKRVPMKKGLSTLKRPVQGRTGGFAKKPKKKKSKSSKDLELRREWLLPTGYNHKLRYVGLRGIYWYWLSRDVRKTEWEKWNGECITCLVPLATWEEGQCGHMVASSECGEFLRFNRKNLALQHAKCNNPRFNPNAGARNAVHYDMRYGQGAWDRLYALRKVECKNPKQEEYRELIRALPSYQEAVDKLTQSQDKVLE